MTTLNQDQAYFYKILLQSTLKDIEAAVRMLDRFKDREDNSPEEFSGQLWADTVAAKSTLRRAVQDAKSGMEAFENES